MEFKNADEIKTAVAAGKLVFWRNPGYQVIMDSKGQTFIQCQFNGYCTMLTDKDGNLAGNPADFFTGLLCPRCEENQVSRYDEVCWSCAQELADGAAWAEHKAACEW